MGDAGTCILSLLMNSCDLTTALGKFSPIPENRVSKFDLSNSVGGRREILNNPVPIYIRVNRDTL